MPGRFPSLVKTCEVTTAKRRHQCQRCSVAVVMGERRLAIKVERDLRHYCLACATAVLQAAEKQIADLKSALEGGG